jgi:hypothetical protein
MTTNIRRPLPAHAQRLWAQLQSNFLDLTKTLMEIIETEAWKPTWSSVLPSMNIWDVMCGNSSSAKLIADILSAHAFGERG